MEVERLSSDPEILLLRDFISEGELRHLLKKADGKFGASKTVCNKSEGCISNVRTSSSAFLRYDPILEDISRRARTFAGLPHSEEIQVVRYFEGQEFKPHIDAFDLETEGGRTELGRFDGRQRDATFLIYLSGPEKGGATRFTELGLDVAPVPGAAVFWRNVLGDGSGRINPRTRHAGLPVLSGVKYAANLWLRGQKVIGKLPAKTVVLGRTLGDAQGRTQAVRRDVGVARIVSLGFVPPSELRLGEFKPSPEKDSKQFGFKLDRRSYSGTKHTLEQMARMIKDGSASPAMRQFANAVVTNAGYPASVRISDLKAATVLLDYVRKNVRYRPDPNQVEYVQSPEITLCVPGASICIPVGDCFPEGTLLLRNDFSFVPIEEIRVGDKIWGKDKWTRVEGKKLKGKLSVDAIEMNNGSTMYLTPDHKVYVGYCKHGKRSPDRTCHPGKCKVEFDRIRVADLHDDDVLLQPEKISFGRRSMDVGRAYVEGLALADGWVNAHPTRFHIAGRDGMRKEKQKHEVKEICDRLGIETHWHRRYITVKDPEWSVRLLGLGERARFKHIETIDLEETTAEAMLRGVMADSTANSSGGGGRTYSTTSPLMAKQVRVLHRMFGRSTSVKMLTPEQHGGAGQHPLWRIGVRDPSEGRADKTLMVRSIERNVQKVVCWDITTEDHYVYLPEHDVTVSNCDDEVTALGALMGAYGIQVKIMKQTFDASAEQEHVLIIFKDAERGDGLGAGGGSNQWLAADPTVDKPIGWRASALKEVVIDPMDPAGAGDVQAEYVGVGAIPMMGTTRDDVVAMQTRLEDLQLATELAVEACGTSKLNDAAWTTLSQQVLAYVSSDPSAVDVASGMALAQQLYTWGDALQKAGCQRPVPAALPLPDRPPSIPEPAPWWASLAEGVAYSAVAIMGIYGVVKVAEVIDDFRPSGKHLEHAAAEARRLVSRR